ncbi:MAG: hypothetical protein KKF88_06895 [Alphaproteobacteria bacterium]|nr:hypothetical protein [Alphaproteobacteria bacterium]
MIRELVLLVTLSSLSAGCAGTPRVAVATAEAACTVATARVTAERNLPTAHVALCDPVSEADSPDGYYVLGLRAHCREELCGSTLMGWFAVEAASGAVFEWNVAEGQVGAEVAGE